MTDRLLDARTLGTLLVCFLGSLGCRSEERLPGVAPETPFRADGIVEFYGPDSALVTRIAVEIAEGDSARRRGLMHRRELPSKGGMLFVDDKPDTQSFWMENTPIPLDMIFVDDVGRVLNVERARPFSRQTVRSAGPARYNIEVRAGFAARHKIDDRAFIRWRRLEDTAP